MMGEKLSKVVLGIRFVSTVRCKKNVFFTYVAIRPLETKRSKLCSMTIRHKAEKPCGIGTFPTKFLRFFLGFLPRAQEHSLNLYSRFFPVKQLFSASKSRFQRDLGPVNGHKVRKNVIYLVHEANILGSAR